MKRMAMDQLLEWKNSSDRKPLVLRGARQVGKTWLMKEFAVQHYKNYVYINFDEEKDIQSVFENNKNPHRLLELLAVIKGVKIEPKNTLIILDEIQECVEALNSLKYFCEEANEYHVIAAGSLLGTILARPKSYPVGKVNLLDIQPLNFSEFLAATDVGLWEYYSKIKPGVDIEDYFHNRLIEMVDYYLIVGGMPECVASWIKYKDAVKVAKIQKELVTVYENDFSKYNGRVNSAKILMVFRSIVSQLAKANEKFIYGAVRSGARAKDFEEAIEWLVSAGMLIRIHNVSKIEHPLMAFEKLDQFKLFLFDVGLLKYMAGLDNGAILLHRDFQFRGPLTENFVLQQMTGVFEVPLHYFAGKNHELDFVLQQGDEVKVVEVKAGENKSASSFKGYLKNEDVDFGIRFSRRGLVRDGKVLNLPLYLAGKVQEWL